MSTRKFTLSTAALSLAILTGNAGAETPDEIVLRDGSRILGTIIDARDGTVKVKTGFAGTVSIQLDQVESLNSSSAATLLLEDDTVVSEQPLRIEQGLLVTGEQRAQKYPLGALAALNPQPWELGQGYRWTGLVDFALVFERGNTDTDELDYRLESTWRSTRDRYRLQARGEIDETNGEKTTDNWLVRTQWDYFLTEPNYWGILGQAEKDQFADLDLRWLAGPFIGREFFNKPIFALSGEFGFSYVSENFNVAEDQEYGAANWNIELTSDYLGADRQLYLQQFGLWNLEDTSDLVVNTSLGLSFPLMFNFQASAEILWEFDSGAVENVDELDETYRLRIGYTW